VRNEAVARLDGLVGTWKLTLTNAWFLDRMDVEQQGSATVEWLDDAFLVLRGGFGADVGGGQVWEWVFGRSDANEQYLVLYHDGRGVSRLFRMTFGDGQWTMVREDPDFHQRFVATVEPDRILGSWDASEDSGKTWRKDFDLIFERQV
jgi:hypothetical protein